MNEEEFEFAKNNSVYAGTYMFNVDKEGSQLGFEISASDVNTNRLNNDVQEFINDNLFGLWKYRGSVNDESFDSTIKERILTEDALDSLPCVSYEGASNAQVSAGTFFTLDEYNRYIHDNNVVIKDENGNDVVLGGYDKWSDYITATLEPRYTYTEDYEDKSFYDDLTFGHMRRAIEWVASNYKPYSKGQDLLAFKDDFTKNDVKKGYAYFFFA